jgi:hypothetical protein
MAESAAFKSAVCAVPTGAEGALGASSHGSEFRCPFSIGGNAHCQLFEATLRQVPKQSGTASTLRVTCRHLVVDGATAGQAGSRCLLGDAKSRRDHLA